MKNIRLGYSPCPNDTFLFYPLIEGLVDTEGLVFEPVLDDVETLNGWALEGRLPMSKVSYGVLGQVCPRYWCLRSGGALGRGCGPLLVAPESRDAGEVLAGPVAVPGLHTTANLLLELRAGRPVKRVPMPFDEIMPSVARGEVPAGLIIHEGRFTYPRYGLVAIEDLGAWWERETGLPIPLGGILLKRDLPGVDVTSVQRVLRRSVEYALANPGEPLEYVRRHAQELEDSVIQEHIRLYVNEFSVDVGVEGAEAVQALTERGVRVGAFPRCSSPIFPPPQD